MSQKHVDYISLKSVQILKGGGERHLANELEVFQNSDV